MKVIKLYEISPSVLRAFSSARLTVTRDFICGYLAGRREISDMLPHVPEYLSVGLMVYVGKLTLGSQI